MLYRLHIVTGALKPLPTRVLLKEPSAPFSLHPAGCSDCIETAHPTPDAFLDHLSIKSVRKTASCSSRGTSRQSKVLSFLHSRFDVIAGPATMTRAGCSH